MARHAAPSSRSPWRPFALAVAAALVLVGTSSGVLAVLRAVATGSQSVSTGTLSLVLARNGTFGTAISGATPNDLHSRFVTVTNNGTLAGKDLTLSVTGTGTAALLGTIGLRLTVTECPAPWTVTGVEGSCSGTPTTHLSSQPVSALAAPRVLAADNAAGLARHYRIQIRVPDNSDTVIDGTPPPNSTLGGSAALLLTFSEDQRAAATVAS